MRQSKILLLALAISLGIVIALIDSSPGWDDTGITGGLIFLICAGLGTLRPDWAWLWALAVGVWIPVLGIYRTHNYAAGLALVVAFVGAYSGALIKKLATSQ